MKTQIIELDMFTKLEIIPLTGLNDRIYIYFYGNKLVCEDDSGSDVEKMKREETQKDARIKELEHAVENIQHECFVL